MKVDIKATQQVTSRLIPVAEKFDCSDFHVNITDESIDIIVKGKKPADKIVGVSMQNAMGGK